MKIKNGARLFTSGNDYDLLVSGEEVNGQGTEGYASAVHQDVAWSEAAPSLE